MSATVITGCLFLTRLVPLHLDVKTGTGKLLAWQSGKIVQFTVRLQ